MDDLLFEVEDGITIGEMRTFLDSLPRDMDNIKVFMYRYYAGAERIKRAWLSFTDAKYVDKNEAIFNTFDTPDKNQEGYPDNPVEILCFE